MRDTKFVSIRVNSCFSPPGQSSSLNRCQSVSIGGPYQAPLDRGGAAGSLALTSRAAATTLGGSQLCANTTTSN